MRLNLTEYDFSIFKDIESIREDIKSKALEISIMDYGAGNPLDSRTKEESYNGIEKVTTTKEQCAIGLKDNSAHTLYYLVKLYKPKTILELGTCCGFSSIYMAKANQTSTIYTLEGDISIANIAEKNINKSQCMNIVQKVGRFQDILENVLVEINKVDLAFIDGHHDEFATIEYFNKIKPYLSSHAIVIFDDISWSEGMKNAWNIIKRDSVFRAYDDMSKIGICYLGNK